MGTRAAGYFRQPGPAGPPSANLRGLLEQQQAFAAHCRRADLEVAATFVDRCDGGPSAFDDLLALLRNAPGDITVVIDHVEVLASDGREAALRLFRLASLDAAVVCLTCDDGDPTEALIDLWETDGHREHVGERVRDAMRRKAVKGEVLGRPPYGYRAGARHRLEAVPEEAAVVRDIFQWYTQENLGIRLIARRLNEMGIHTRRGGNWSMVTIRDILRNRVYLGTYARFGVRVAGSHAALIAADEFRRAQDRMESRRTSGGPRSVSNFLLSGLAACGACGSRMIGVSRRQSWQRRGDGGVSTAEYRYYQCGSRTNQSICGYHTRRAADLDEQVRAATVEALRHRLDERATQTDERPPSTGGAGNAAGAADGERLRARLRALDRDLERLLDQAAARQISRERLRVAGVEIALRRQQIEATLRVRRPTGSTGDGGTDASAGTPAHDPERTLLGRLAADWPALDFDERRAVLREAIELVRVFDDHVETVLRPRAFDIM